MLIYLIKSKDKYAMVYILSAVPIFFIRGVQKGYFIDDILSSNYIIYPSFFLLVVFGNYMKSRKKGLIALALVFIIFSISLGQFHVGYGLSLKEYVFFLGNGKLSSIHAYNEMKDILERPIEYLPRNKGYAIADYNAHAFLRAKDTDLDYSKIDGHSAPQNSLYYDWYTPNLIQYKVFNSSWLPYTLNDHEMRLVEKIENNGYEMAFIGPGQSQTHLSHILSSIDTSKKNYCTVFLPLIGKSTSGNMVISVLLSEKSQCMDLLERNFNNIVENADRLCETDEFLTKKVIEDFNVNHKRYTVEGGDSVAIDFKCASGKQTLKEIERVRKKASDIDFLTLLFMIFSFAMVHKSKL